VRAGVPPCKPACVRACVVAVMKEAVAACIMKEGRRAAARRGEGTAGGEGYVSALRDSGVRVCLCLRADALMCVRVRVRRKAFACARMPVLILMGTAARKSGGVGCDPCLGGGMRTDVGTPIRILTGGFTMGGGRGEGVNEGQKGRWKGG
jgi:hypothetical protein